MEILARSQKISFNPTSLMEEVEQNVRTILTTVKGSVPLDREFGIDAALLDSPSPVVLARLSGVVIAAIKRYEPRVEVLKVSYKQDGEGHVTPLVTVKIHDSTG